MSDYGDLEYLWNLPEKPKAVEDLPPLPVSTVTLRSGWDQAEAYEAFHGGLDKCAAYARKHGAPVPGVTPEFASLLEKHVDGEALNLDVEEKGFWKRLLKKARTS
jgi:hypothetical protein